MNTKTVPSDKAWGRHRNSSMSVCFLNKWLPTNAHMFEHFKNYPDDLLGQRFFLKNRLSYITAYKS